jgi:hypothetical protein
LKVHAEGGPARPETARTTWTLLLPLWLVPSPLSGVTTTV